jgi:hypothetical protein
MAKKDKKDKKDRKEKKDKKDRSNKKRKRDSSDSDDDRGQKRLEQEACSFLTELFILIAMIGLTLCCKDQKSKLSNLIYLVHGAQPYKRKYKANDSLQADRLTAALRKGTTEAFATDDGQLQLGSRFVWKKKIESELQGGAKTKDIYEREKKNTEAERRVRSLICAPQSDASGWVSHLCPPE